MSPKPAFRSDDGVLTSKVARVDEQVTGIGGLNIKDVDFAKHNIKNQDLTNQQRKKKAAFIKESLASVTYVPTSPILKKLI